MTPGQYHYNCKYFDIVNDTITALFNDKYFAKYYDYKWNIIDSNIKEIIFNSIDDKDLLKDKKMEDVYIHNMYLDENNNNYWYSFSLHNTDQMAYLYFYSKEKKYFFKEYYNDIDDTLRFIRKSSVYFDNNNLPYFIVWKASNTQDEDYSICKLDGDTLKTVFTSNVPSTGKYYESNGKNHSLLFDSKNNYWTYAEDKILYFVNDTINKEFTTWDIVENTKPPVSRGIEYMFLYKDELIVVLKDMTVATYRNDEWKVEFDFRYFVESLNKGMSLAGPKAMMGESKLFLYYRDQPNFLFIKDLTDNKWSYELIPEHFLGSSITLKNKIYRYYTGTTVYNLFYKKSKNFIPYFGAIINLEDE